MPKELEKSLAIVGNDDIIMGFRALGFMVYPVKEPLGFRAALADIMQKKVAVCLVEESLYQANVAEINKVRNVPLPVFMPFSKNNQTHILDTIVSAVKLRATGTL